MIIRARRKPADEYGRAVFDGLAPGEYTFTVFAHGYPVERRAAGGPRHMTLAAGSCATEVVPRRARRTPSSANATMPGAGGGMRLE